VPFTVTVAFFITNFDIFTPYAVAMTLTANTAAR